ncbi:hypothetical protein Ancab_032610 [Ancistrocladus abbreviatus]
MVQRLVGGANRATQEEALKKHKLAIVGVTLGWIAEIDAAATAEDMRQMLEHLGRRSGAERLTIMVSETVPFSVIRAARSWGQDPVLVKHRVDTLRRLCSCTNAKFVIVFMNHNKQLKDTVFKLEACRMKAAELRDNLSQLPHQ